MENLRQFWKGPAGKGVGPDDVLGMRKTANRWNVASKHGPYGELFFIFITKEPNVEFEHSLDAPCVKYELLVTGNAG